MSDEPPPPPPETLFDLASVATALLREDGEALRVNAAFLRIQRDAGLAHACRALVHPSFSDLLAHAPPEQGWREIHRGLVHLGAPEGVARSHRALVLRAPGHLLVIAEPERETVERLHEEVLHLNEELAELHRAQARDIAALRRTEAELRRALEQVRTLRGLLPICAHCKKIQNDEGYWERVESYVSRHSEADFSHGICQDCLQTELARLDEPGAP